jgi:hypothetical protein
MLAGVACPMPAADELGGLVSRLVSSSGGGGRLTTRDHPQKRPQKLRAIGRRVTGTVEREREWERP